MIEDMLQSTISTGEDLPLVELGEDGGLFIFYDFVPEAEVLDLIKRWYVSLGIYDDLDFSLEDTVVTYQYSELKENSVGELYFSFDADPESDDSFPSTKAVLW